MGLLEEAKVRTTNINWSNNESGRKREGYLMKKGKGESIFGRKSWKKRWFVLEKGRIKYYENKYTCENKLDSYGSLKLAKGTTVERYQDEKREFAMLVKTATRDLYLCAKTEEDLLSWIADFKVHIKFVSTARKT